MPTVVDVSESGHVADGSGPDLEGYATCANTWCGALVLEVIAQRTRGFCVECWTSELRPDLVEITVRHAGERTALPMTQAPSKQRANRRNKSTDRLIDHCKRRALKRLKTIFPDLYDILLAEERARVGLNPWPIEMAARSGPDPDAEQTMV